MGKHGPQSTHPTGRGYTTKKGYHRLDIWDPATKSSRHVFAHVLVWEEANGPVPAGFVVHHVNGDKQDNRLANLCLVGALEHKRLHSGCELREGVWYKPCSICKQLKPLTSEHWYFTREGWPAHGRCRPCHIARVCADKRTRKARRSLQPDTTA